MDSITDVVNLLNMFLDETQINDIARRTGFLVRQSKITPCDFLKCMVLTCLKETKHSLRNITINFQKECSLKVSRNALSNKFNSSGLKFIKELASFVFRNSSIFNSFQFVALPGIKHVNVTDSSEIKLDDKLENIFKGMRNRKSIMKVQTIVDFLQGSLVNLDLTSGNCPDQGYKGYLNHTGPDTLNINDLGYFCTENLAQIVMKGGFFLSRYQRSALLYNGTKKEKGKKICLAQKLSEATTPIVEFNAFLGDKHRLWCRVIAIRLSEEAYGRRLVNQKRQGKRDRRIPQDRSTELDKWSILVTNLSPAQLCADMAWEVYACRWQIELLFKVLKSHYNLGSFTHKNPYRTQIEVYIKYISVWIMMTIAMGISKKEISLSKATSVFKQFCSILFVKSYDALYSGVSKMTDYLMTYAVKEVRPKRLTSKQTIGWGLIEIKEGSQKMLKLTPMRLRRGDDRESEGRR